MKENEQLSNSEHKIELNDQVTDDAKELNEFVIANGKQDPGESDEKDNKSPSLSSVSESSESKLPKEVLNQENPGHNKTSSLTDMDFVIPMKKKN